MKAKEYEVFVRFTKDHHTLMEMTSEELENALPFLKRQSAKKACNFYIRPAESGRFEHLAGFPIHPGRGPAPSNLLMRAARKRKRAALAEQDRDVKLHKERPTLPKREPPKPKTREERSPRPSPRPDFFDGGGDDMDRHKTERSKPVRKDSDNTAMTRQQRLDEITSYRPRPLPSRDARLKALEEYKLELQKFLEKRAEIEKTELIRADVLISEFLLKKHDPDDIKAALFKASPAVDPQDKSLFWKYCTEAVDLAQALAQERKKELEPEKEKSQPLAPALERNRESEPEKPRSPAPGRRNRM